MNAEQREKYLASDGVRCPFCGSDALGGKSVAINGTSASQEIFCLACDKEWEDTYVLVNSTVIEG